MRRELHTGFQGADIHDRNVLRKMQEESHCRRQEREKRADIERKTNAESGMPELRNQDDEVHEVVLAHLFQFSQLRVVP